MRKFWYLDPQYNNLLHLVDDVAVPMAEIWRRIVTSSALQILVYQAILMVMIGIGIHYLMRSLLKKQAQPSLQLIKTLEYYFISRGY